MKSNNKFVMLVGLPGSGKSTFRKNFLKDHPDYIVISSDDFIEEYAAERGKKYDEIFTEAAPLANSHIFKLLGDCIRDGASILWDQTNLTEKKRHRVLKQLPNAYQTAAVCFEIDEDVRQDRIKNRPGKTIPEAIDTAMQRTYVRPTVDEGFDYVYVVTLEDQK